MSQKIKSILSHILNAKATTWQNELIKNWPHIIGNLDKRMFLKKVKNDTLIIGVYDSNWLQELHILSHLLLKKINSHLQNSYVKKLYFVYSPKYNTDKKKSSSLKYRQINTESFTLKPKEKLALNKIKNPELQKALKLYLMRCNQEKNK